ncbi:MAG: hypothetical protein M0036_17360 [Desulfobacteraceae bacterium]|nr:hypothetical protein [Desulfobacteraceae bacterium]
MNERKCSQKLINGINRLGRTWAKMGESRARNYCASRLPETLFLTMRSNVGDSDPKVGNGQYKNKQEH